MLSKVKAGEKKEKLRGEVISRIIEMYVKIPKWHLDASSRLVTIEVGQKFWGLRVIFWEGSGVPI